MSNAPGTLSELKPNPLHLHCAAVCAAEYPLTKDYAPVATHFRVLKPSPYSIMQLSTAIIILSTAVIMKSILHHLI